MSPAGFELAILGIKLLQTYVLDRRATGIGPAFDFGIFCRRKRSLSVSWVDFMPGVNMLRYGKR